MATTSTGVFAVRNGQIIGPDGQPFIAAGIDVMNGSNNPSVSQIQADFRGINFVRLAIYNYDSPQSLATYVNQLTAAGIVVELENHNNGAGDAGGDQGTIFTGSALTQEQNWYSSVASAFKSNPRVWFGTNNEPSETDSSGKNDPAALSAWQEATYNTIRATGNNNPVLLEAVSFGPGKTNAGFVTSDYSGMHNVIWDIHYYGWISGYSTNQTTVDQTLSGMVSDTHAITSADGTMPVVIGEYGNSTTGATIDANGTQVVNTVIKSGLGSAAWAWGTGGPGDGLTTSGGGVSTYGQQVAAGIAAKAAAAPPPPVSGGGAAPSANDTVVKAGTSGSIVDAAGNTWTISNGVVDENGAPAGYSANVAEIAYVNGTVWQENASKQWWGWSNGGWNTGGGTTTSPLPPDPVTPSANDTVVMAGSKNGITDAAGNVWTITTGNQVAVNGAADSTTANVTELAYVDGAVWQENASKLWWEKTSPTSAWGPTAGTSTSPLPAPVPPPPPVPGISVTAGGQTTVVSAVSASGSQVVDGSIISLLAPGVATVAVGATAVSLSFTHMAGVVVLGGSAVSASTADGGSNTFVAGTGAMAVTGGSGSDSYDVMVGSGSLTIADFSASKGDTITISSALKAVMTTASDNNGGTLIGFGGLAGPIDLHHVTTVPTIHTN